MKPTLAPYFLFVWLLVYSLPCFGQAPNSPTPVAQDQKELSVNWLYGAYVPKDVPLVTLNGNQRWKLYVKQTFTTPGIYAKTVLFAAGDQITDSPREWDRDLGGFGLRLASRHGQFVIQSSLSALGNAALGYEPRYDVCRCSGFWPRISHAAMRNFVTYDRSEVRKRPQFAMYGAAFGAGAISSTWQPNQGAWHKAYRSAISQAGFGVLSNLLGEFAPEIKRIIR